MHNSSKIEQLACRTKKKKSDPLSYKLNVGKTKKNKKTLSSMSC